MVSVASTLGALQGFPNRICKGMRLDIAQTKAEIQDELFAACWELLKHESTA